MGLEWGDHPRCAIALCGYEGEHAIPESGSVSSGRRAAAMVRREWRRENAGRERIWFSPYCQKSQERLPFSELMGTAMRDADEAAERWLRGTDKTK